MPAAPDAQPRKSGSTSLLACTPSLTFWLLLLWIVGLLASVAPGRSSALLPASQLRSLGMILDASAPLSFPEKIVVSPRGNLFLLDTELSNVFLVNKNTREIKALCSPRMPIQPSDISADKIGNIWVINSREKRVAKLDDRCGMQTSFICRNFPIALLINSLGELVVLTGEGEALFEVYNSAGKLLRSFGQRLRYGDPIVDSELSAGHLAPDSNGGFYFSFNYPPLIRHYANNGRLIGEFKPESDIKIEPPQISSRRQGNRLAVSSRYQILILDLGVDSRGRLLLLMSGENKYQALSKGSRSLLVTNRSGKTVAKFDLGEGPFNRLAAGNGFVYLLRNRTPLRLDKFAVP